MFKQIRSILVAAILIGSADVTFAEKTKGMEDASNKVAGPEGLAAECAPPSTSIELDLNNIRTLIQKFST